ncbi:putative non-specific serine/threonine protein kinase [Rosa chinensis]|uniref:Putative non-specific serine/threonine protein kinase n=1 Tax=Rosa chinensis TaxID=74649 RepID=A0A2P6RDD1_ROSCH|nr:putative non-specific serine/threonine protein kinase [Rosa chinensis]
MACELILGLACCCPNPHQRPSMRTVIKVLTREADSPFSPTEGPAFVWPAKPQSFRETTLDGSQITTFTELSGR